MSFTLADADEFVRRQDLRRVEAALHAYAERERRKVWQASAAYRSMMQRLNQPPEWIGAATRAAEQRDIEQNIERSWVRSGFWRAP